MRRKPWSGCSCSFRHASTPSKGFMVNQGKMSPQACLKSQIGGLCPKFELRAWEIRWNPN
ncbi:unnamed protein product [Prunus brigantina]